MTPSFSLPNRKTLTLLFSALIALMLLFVGEEKIVPPQAALDNETATVTRIIDGDTIEVLLNGESERVRYIGIDTPESVDPRRDPECFGSEAAKENERLVLGKTVRLKKDVSERDRYGRLLRFVYVDTTLINEVLVEEGYATAATFPPDVSMAETFRSAEQTARENKSGLWASCVTTTGTSSSE